jgi:isoquinoline 1-oxidoreductase beta subunit
MTSLLQLVRQSLHRSEMGTGVRTSLPGIVAVELEADWNRVKVIQGEADARYGCQDTDGSHSVREFFDTMREAGATARVMLVRAAAQQWNVTEPECRADLHSVIHKVSSWKLGYGELVAAAAQLPVPKKEELQFKPKSAWRYIGKDARHYDVEDLCTGKPLFGMDVGWDGMLYAAIAHPPALGGKPASVDDTAASQVTGVKQTVLIEPFHPPHAFQALGGIAVIADNTFAAFKGRKKLNIVWGNGPNSVYSSDAFKKRLQEQRASRLKSCVTWCGRSVCQGRQGCGGRVLHLAHASMEPRWRWLNSATVK